MNKRFIDWLIFILLSLIWGSSFILMKLGLDNQLSPYQIASLRIVSAGLILLPIAIKAFNKVPKHKLWIVFLSGVFGSLLPAYLFCIAEEGIDSALAGTLNSLTPIFVIINGALFFKLKTPANKIVGIAIAFTGSVLLLISKGHMQESQHLIYVGFVILATFFYGINVNMVAKYLLQIPSLHIAAIALSLSAIPAMFVLVFTGFFSLPFNQHSILIGASAAVVLGIAGTAIASVLFYMLVKRAGSIFASTVTYGIPFVAIGWGILYNENFGLLQTGCLVIILLVVYWANRRVIK